jgi:hypothetical protein
VGGKRVQFDTQEDQAAAAAAAAATPKSSSNFKHASIPFS